MMCAGVQKVSRPIDMCHEMSQCPPVMLDVIPAIMHQIGHGTDSTRAEVCSLNRAWKGCPRGMVSAICRLAPRTPLEWKTSVRTLSMKRVYNERRLRVILS